MHLISTHIQSSKNLLKTIFPFLFFALLAANVQAQEKKRVEIIQAESLVQSETIADAQRLLNDVIVKHNDILVYCDSAYTYEGTNRVDAFGRVHINQGDTLHLYANKIFYDGDRSFAQAIHNVRLENKEITLYTDTLDFDMNLNIAYYNCKGRIVDSTNTLTSQIGKYYLDEDVIDFIEDVEGNNEGYTIKSEKLKYNTITEVVYFEGPTFIEDSTNTLFAEDGWYNTLSGEASLKSNPQVFNETQFLSADDIDYNDASGNGVAIGNVHMEDYENRTIVEGWRVEFNELTEVATATDSAVFIAYNNTDSLYLHADTLQTMPDTIDGERLVRAFYGVRFFRTDIQGVCDSLIYFTKDSVVQLHTNPVIWSEIHQLSAEQISLRQNTDAPDELHMTNNSFIISKQDSGRFDQIKGKKMIGFVVNGELDKVNVDGNGQTMYYARDKEAVIGLNNAESSNIAIQFKEGQIHTINFKKQPTGKLIPLANVTEENKRLPGFDWKIMLRPVSKKDIFRKIEIKPSKEVENSEMKSATGSKVQ